MDYVKYIRSMTGTSKIILNAGAGIIVKNHQILLQHRADNNKWGLIGGIMEMGETYSDTAKREIKEETGLEVSLDYLIGIYHNDDMVWPSGDKAHVICATYKCSIKSGNLLKDEESLELKWFSLDSLPELFATDHKKALADYLAGLKNQER